MNQTEKLFVVKAAYRYSDPDVTAKTTFIGPLGTLIGTKGQVVPALKAQGRGVVEGIAGGLAGGAAGAGAGAAGGAATAALMKILGKNPEMAAVMGIPAAALGAGGLITGAMAGVYHGARKSVDNSNKEHAPLSRAAHMLLKKLGK